MEEMVTSEMEETEQYKATELRNNIIPKKAQSSHLTIIETAKKNKITKSAHFLRDMQHNIGMSNVGRDNETVSHAIFNFSLKYD